MGNFNVRACEVVLVAQDAAYRARGYATHKAAENDAVESIVSTGPGNA